MNWRAFTLIFVFPGCYMHCASNSIRTNRATNGGDGRMMPRPTAQAAQLISILSQATQPSSVQSVEGYRKQSARYDTMSICCDAKQKCGRLLAQYADLRRWSVMLRVVQVGKFLLSAFEVPMLAMNRTLRLKDDPTAYIPVHVFMPVQDTIDWSCAFSIGWPSGTLKRHTVGIDAIQSLQLALRMIGTELYASEYHKTGQLMWLKLGAGYGFPVPNLIRDTLIGEDRDFL